MASASDVPLKAYKPLYSRDLLKGKVAFVTGKGLCVRLPAAAVGAWLVGLNHQSLTHPVLFVHPRWWLWHLLPYRGADDAPRC